VEEGSISLVIDESAGGVCGELSKNGIRNEVFDLE
jgi:hypothetical protein